MRSTWHVVPRCLEEQHSATCAVCSPAPAFDQVDGWKFLGISGALRLTFVSNPGFLSTPPFTPNRAGQRDTVKRVISSPEAFSLEAREHAAAVVGEDLPGLAKRLLNMSDPLRSSPCLNKVEVMALCGAWGLKSDLWQPIGAAPRMRRPNTHAPRPSLLASRRAARTD